MASAFDLIAEINLESRGFQGSIQGVVSKLQSADAALDKTIAKSNRLGDTSATVARRYEKFSESIKAQKDRLLDNALAFEKGEISAKQFTSVVTSVEKATAGLSSKLKDAKVRLDELNETGLTHFEQSISKAVDQANGKLESFRQKILAAQAPQSVDLVRNLSGFQKTQLSFQANDIITGLLSGQNPLQIAAQQGGQVFQILQQTKVAQEGVATATAAAAASQAAFTASSTAAVAPQAAVAASAAATAASTQATAAAMTILGAPIVAVGAVLAVIIVDLLAIYRATRDIEAAAKLRLATEEAITGELNKQRLAVIEFAKERAKSQAGREFDRFLGSAGTTFLESARSDRDNELSRLQRQVDAAIQTRGAVLSAVPFIKDDEKRREYLTQDVKPQLERITQLREELNKLDATIDEKRAKITSTVTGYSGVIDVAMAHAAAVRKGVEDRAVEAAKEAEKKRKEMVDKAVKDAKEFAERVKQAPDVITSIFANTSNNPLTRIFLEGESAVQKMLEATKGLGSELQRTLANLLQNQTASKALVQQMDNALKSLNLRKDAGRFIPNNLSKLSDSDFLQKQLNAIGAGGPITQYFDQAKLAEIDKKIIALTANADPSKLTYAQNRLASDARLREADRTDTEEKEDRSIRRELNATLKELAKAITTGAVVRIVNEAPDKAKTNTRPRAADSNAFFGGYTLDPTAFSSRGGTF